jgi:heme/copper-type cytochrome/quinol oxidase subunit 4
MQNFFHTKEAKRGYWTILNTLMALGVSFVAYMASENVAVAVTVLPFAQAISQFLTKYINDNYL